MKVVRRLFFAKAVDCTACGLFGIEHIVLALFTILGIIIAVKYIKINQKEKIKNIILKSTILIWILEIIKIIFNLCTGNARNINTYVPLYYCSILLYAGLFSSFGKGKVKRLGDVFIATGGIIAGIIFLIFPTTSLKIYNAWHFITIQSFLYHGLMLYLGIIVNKYNYIELNKKDIIYYAILIVIIAIPALIINEISDSNLMFISQDYPGTAITYLYNIFGKSFTFIMILCQASLPFYIIYYIKKLFGMVNAY